MKGLPMSLKVYEEVFLGSKYEPEALWAVLSVESGMWGFDRERNIKLRFEREKFKKFVSEKEYEEFEKLSQGKQKNRDLFEIAESINKIQAYKSTSFGIGQIMGFHHKVIGYKSVEDMVKDFRQGEDAQVRGFIKFLEKSGAGKHLINKDWQSFARIYNGPGYEIHSYDKRVEAWYQKHKAFKPDFYTRNLQIILHYLGYNPGPVDGIWGNWTQTAVELFCNKENLKNCTKGKVQEIYKYAYEICFKISLREV
jgi:hypothetical protein